MLALRVVRAVGGRIAVNIHGSGAVADMGQWHPSRGEMVGGLVFVSPHEVLCFAVCLLLMWIVRCHVWLFLLAVLLCFVFVTFSRSCVVCLPFWGSCGQNAGLHKFTNVCLSQNTRLPPLPPNMTQLEIDMKWNWQSKQWWRGWRKGEAAGFTARHKGSPRLRKGGAADVATGKNLPRAVQYNHCKYKYTHLYIDTNTLKPLKLVICSKCKE